MLVTSFPFLDRQLPTLLESRQSRSGPTRGGVPPFMLVIGLTGGIGTGKSTISEFLQEMGGTLLDADKVGHESYTPGYPAYNDLVAEFGNRIVGDDRQINRKELGTIVFSDPDQLAKLNGIVHPHMRRMMQEKLDDMRTRGVAVVVLEAAILIEANWIPLVDEVWVTDAPEETVIQRVKNRNNFNEEQVRGRIRSQLSSAERNARADVLIDTDCSLDEVREMTRSLWNERVARKV